MIDGCRLQHICRKIKSISPCNEIGYFPSKASRDVQHTSWESQAGIKSASVNEVACHTSLVDSLLLAAYADTRVIVTT